MADFSRFIPVPMESTGQLANLLSFWNDEVCKKEKQGKSYIYSAVFSDDEERNVIWFKDSITAPLAPKKVADYAITLGRDERRKAIMDLEDAENLELRSSAIVLFANGKKKWVALFDAAPAKEQQPAPVPTPVAKFVKTRARVSNRGVPPPEFLQELAEWGKTAPAEIFEDRPTGEKDVYASVKGDLGPYGDLLHRKACLLEVMRVLAGFESSWKWNSGRDTTNRAENSPDTISAGPFQVSANSMGFGRDLRDLVAPHGIRDSVRDGAAFQALMKANHVVAFNYISHLLRHTIRHNGPVKRGEIDEWLSKDAVQEFQQLLTT